MLKLSTHMQTLKGSSWRTFSTDKERTLENARCESQDYSPQREFFSRSGRKMNIRNGNRFLCWAHTPVLTVWGTRQGGLDPSLKQSWRNALGFLLSSSCWHKHSITDWVTELWRPRRRCYQSEAIILASHVLPWSYLWKHKGKEPCCLSFFPERYQTCWMQVPHFDLILHPMLSYIHCLKSMYEKSRFTI